MDPHPKWLIARDPDRSRLLLVHTEPPQFRAEVFALNDPEGILDPSSYDLHDGRSLANFTWDDEPPQDLKPLLAEADRALAQYRTSRRTTSPASRGMFGL